MVRGSHAAVGRARGGLFRKLRITLLLVLLVALALGTWQARLMVTDWEEPLWVTLHPVAGDGSPAARDYVAGLVAADFRPVERFFAEEAAHYRVALAEPVTVRVAPPLDAQPPLPPEDGNLLGIVAWSLRLRWWAYRVGRRADSPPADIRLFLRYFDPETAPRLPHSLGLSKAQVGIVNLYADPRYAPRNRVVLSHELLHTLGATDKYDPETNRPVYPEGYAEPDREPLLPQERAELMGGRIPLPRGGLRMPDGLAETVIGSRTAQEIRWR